MTWRVQVWFSSQLPRYQMLLQLAQVGSAAIGRHSNKLAHRASKLNLAHIDCLCSMDLWDHGTTAGALVGHFWPQLCSYKFCQPHPVIYLCFVFHGLLEGVDMIIYEDEWPGIVLLKEQDEMDMWFFIVGDLVADQ